MTLSPRNYSNCMEYKSRFLAPQLARSPIQVTCSALATQFYFYSPCLPPSHPSFLLYYSIRAIHALLGRERSDRGNPGTSQMPTSICTSARPIPQTRNCEMQFPEKNWFIYLIKTENKSNGQPLGMGDPALILPVPVEMINGWKSSLTVNPLSNVIQSHKIQTTLDCLILPGVLHFFLGGKFKLPEINMLLLL